MTASFDVMLKSARDLPDDDPCWEFDDKLDGRTLAQSLGLRVPELLCEPGPLDTIPEPDGSAAVVLKADKGAVARGVFFLKPHPQGWQLPDGRVYDWEGAKGLGVVATVGTSWRKYRDQVHGPWYVEKAVEGDKVSVNYRAFVFGAEEIPLIVGYYRPHVHVGQAYSTAWDVERNWKQFWPYVKKEMKSRKEDLSIPAPPHVEESLELCRLVASRVRSAFIRVDFYDSREIGPVFGEVTPIPAWATVKHTPDIDRRMGEAWLRAERKMR